MFHELMGFYMEVLHYTLVHGFCFFNPLMVKFIFLGQSFYLRMTLTYRISGPVGFSGSKMHTATGPGIASIFVVICKSNHAHFLTSLLGQGQCTLAQKAAVNMQFGGAARGKDCFLHSLMLKTRHVALSAPSMCAPQAAQGLAGAIFTLRGTPPTSLHPTLSAVAEPTLYLRREIPQEITSSAILMTPIGVYSS